jgi:predicted GNAT superfamily acetyltransferase
MPARTAATLDQAWAIARDAAVRAGIDIRELRGVDVTLAREVIGRAWGRQQIPQDNLLRALAHAGGTLLGATADGRPVGVTLGFLGWRDGLHLHSHMTAVLESHRSAGVGYALKLWQRAVCLREGVAEIRWTYDPLVARNAYFNLVKLGATVVAFHVDFYGAMDDTVNAGDHSDRLEVCWRLDSTRVLEALAGRPPPRTKVVRSHVIPEDYAALARADPGIARAARLAARVVLLAAQREHLDVEWDRGAYRFTSPMEGGGMQLSVPGVVS